MGENVWGKVEVTGEVEVVIILRYRVQRFGGRAVGGRLDSSASLLKCSMRLVYTSFGDLSKRSRRISTFHLQ